MTQLIVAARKFANAPGKEERYLTLYNVDLSAIVLSIVDKILI